MEWPRAPPHLEANDTSWIVDYSLHELSKASGARQICFHPVLLRREEFPPDTGDTMSIRYLDLSKQRSTAKYLRKAERGTKWFCQSH